MGASKRDFMEVRSKHVEDEKLNYELMFEETDIFKQNISRIYNKEKALSYSALSAFLKSPKHYYKYVTDKKTTEAMEKGKRFHMAILEPEKFEESYYIFDDTEKVNELILNGAKSPRATTLYKEWKNEELKKYTGKEEVSLDEYNTYQSMIKALKYHSICKHILFGDGENEKPFEFDDGDFIIKGKIDRATDNYTVDIKKVADARYKRIKWDIIDMNYDLQTAIYSCANMTRKHYLIYIDEGCNITVVEVSAETIASYEQKKDFALTEFSRCIEEDKWHMSYDFYQPTIII